MSVIKMRQFTAAMVVVTSIPSLTSCKFLSQADAGSEVKDMACVGTWLGGFLNAIPLPGFDVLGHSFTQAAALIVAGTLKDITKNTAYSACGSASNFSNEQMKQMKQAIAQGFDDQNHKDAVALEDNIETKLAEFVPDQERFTQYTMNKLDDMINAVNTWWSNYDQSKGRVYNINDFIIVTGFGLQAYQHQVREVALEAAYTKSPGDATKVRAYAAILSDKASHVRTEIDDISNKDVVAVATSFWKDDGTKVEKSYDVGLLTYNFCILSKQGRPFGTDNALQEQASHRLPRFLEGMRATKTLADLSDYVQKSGSFCCAGGTSCDRDADKVEPAIKTAIAETSKHVKDVLFTNNPDIMKYFNTTLPTIIAAGRRIRDADDATVFSLASNTGPSTGLQDRSSPVTAPAATPQPNASGGGSGIACPDGDNGPRKGFGGIYQCGSKQCAKTDKSFATECVVGG